MVLTLVIVTDEENAYDALKAASDASREHPSRIIVVIKRVSRSPRARRDARLDAEVRVGSDAGTGETVVLRLHGELANHAQSVVLPLLLPDAPVVVWWPEDAPADPAKDPLGALAQRRITDTYSAEHPLDELSVRAATYRPGRHRPGLDAHHAVALDAGGGARPAARAGRLGDGRGRVGQPELRTAGHVAGGPARGPGGAHPLRRARV